MKKYDVYKWEAEYKLVCVVLYEYIYICMRKITGGYGAKKNCYVGIACFFFFFFTYISH